MCQDQWDASDFMDSCANQQGCTDCAAEGRTWCLPTNHECAEVERDTDGTSLNWFWCEEGTIPPPTAGISSEKKISIFASIKIVACILSRYNYPSFY